MTLSKVLAAIILLGIIAYVVFSIMAGTSSSGKAIYNPDNGDLVKTLSFPECMDTDGGKEFFVQGSTYNIRDNLVFDDYCEDSENLVEYFCTNEFVDRKNIRCNCFMGICR